MENTGGIINSRELKQFKLTTGEQIICEVVQWPDHDDPDDYVGDIVVRNVLSIVAIQHELGNIYTFRPWMMYQDEDNCLMTINENHVVGEANPSFKMKAQYIAVAIGREGGDQVEAATDIENMLKRAAGLEASQDASGDSDSLSKIVMFPGKFVN